MRHGIDLKPIHNVKDAGKSREPDQIALAGNCCFILETSKKPGGAYRDRTDDLKLAKLALSQLS